MMFTPGDIPDALVDMAADEIRANLGHGITATPHEAAAAILNAAIEVGVVSPPVFAYRYTGMLQKSGGEVDAGSIHMVNPLAQRDTK